MFRVYYESVKKQQRSVAEMSDIFKLKDKKNLQHVREASAAKSRYTTFSYFTKYSTNKQFANECFLWGIRAQG